MPQDPISQPGRAELREHYKKIDLDEANLDPNPMLKFRQWFDEAIKSAANEPAAMTLATVNETGEPSARIVLLRNVESPGFDFYTHFDSRKGQELANRSAAALLFYWPELERQVRIEGKVAKIPDWQSDAHFASRPLLTRISICASPQSTAINSRSELARRTEQLAGELGENPPRPANWGGFRLMPDVMEFWQGRRSRLHDRIQFRREDRLWRIERLAP